MLNAYLCATVCPAPVSYVCMCELSHVRTSVCITHACVRACVRVREPAGTHSRYTGQEDARGVRAAPRGLPAARDMAQTSVRASCTCTRVYRVLTTRTHACTHARTQTTTGLILTRARQGVALTPPWRGPHNHHLSLALSLARSRSLSRARALSLSLSLVSAAPRAKGMGPRTQAQAAD